MGEARSEKIAVVDEVREKFSASDAAVLTEYRGLDVPAMAELRRALRESGGEYKVYKNTLVRFAVEELGLEIDDLLTGPTAIAFVGEQADGSAGDPVGVAKALKEFAKANEALIIKGGLLDEKRLTAEEISALAEIAPREVLLAQLAGAMAAPMQQFAALLKALPQNMAYALQALIEQGGAPGAPTVDETDAAPAAEETDATDSSTEEKAADEGTDTVGAPVSQDDNEEEE
ncbi:MAG: 50S ribosomal protein L10 [Acidimicrobiales bacterium]|nr:50S ribosomal protein L10 [Acidimicrobiales bacterium]MDP6286900.1 50S ribosomal protein L10 [Acidimicrobiales bacterium]MDP6911625.1 50S ribosomal protein L10 [Acidimicrobiales bacterium]HJP25469.1 50S ribosomal protein L10 [Acidimicrobiales bacterium]